MKSSCHKDATIQEVLDAKRAVIKEQPPIQKGDYVLATKWHDGSPCDPFCIGFYAEKRASESGNQVRHDVIDEGGTPFYHNGFRRAEAITEEEGKALIALIPEIGDKPGRSLWWHFDCIRGVANPYDPCDEVDNEVDNE